MALPTSYQSVVTATNYDVSQGRPHLQFDGSDDFLLTNSINFTSTDKVSVFAGVRKLSDAATGMLMELSASLGVNNGALYITAPSGAGAATYRLASKGTIEVNATASPFAAPNSSVLAGIVNISVDSAVLRINGAQVSQSTADQGTGTYGNYPLYIGRRGGSSLAFNGHLYSLIIVGRLTTDTETRNTERLIAKQTGVTLA